MKNIIKYADIFFATIVIISLFYIKIYPIFWLIYSIGCFGYIWINYCKKLYGQAILNLIACLIAIRNFIL